MRRRILAALAVLLLPVLVMGGVVTTAAAASANVVITAGKAADGTTTLTYRATATAAGTVRHIQVSIPPGSRGRITSVNGTVTTVAPNVLRWTPSRTVTVGVGARFALPFYGLRLPTGGPWTLGFNATSTTGARISYGAAVLSSSGTSVPVPDVRISATNPIPGQTTSLTYATDVTRAGTLTSVLMQLPAGTRGAITSVNGTLTTSGGYATWTPRSPITVRVGTRLSIPIYHAELSRFGGMLSLQMTARSSTGATLGGGTGTLALIAPPARMPTVSVPSFVSPPPGCPASWPSTAQENARPGTADWVIPAAMYGATAAYLTKVSATCGDTVDIKVTSGKPVAIVAYRMGYYGGLGAREVWRAEQVPTVVQPAPVTGGYDAAGNPLNMTTAKSWTKTLAFVVDQNWVPGTYLIRVDDGTRAAYAPLTVRDDTGTKHDILIQQATTTWQAYNAYGGKSYYSKVDGSGRLSFDRPYGEGQGSGQFLPLEQGLVFWAESKGLDVTYWTDNDLDALGGQLPLRASTLFLPAHDEYYSLTMRAALSQAIDRGVNVANLGANTVYRRITFTDSTRRIWDIDRYSDAGKATTWKWHGDAYASQPLLGADYICWLFGDRLTTGTSWLFDGITPGTVVPGFLAGEIDRVNPNLYRQAGLAVIASGTGTCGANGTTQPMHATTYTAPSGARVLNGSTFAYSCFLVGRCPVSWTVPSPSVASRTTVGIMMANVTRWVTRGQVVVTNPAAAPAVRVDVPEQTIQMHDER